MCPLHDQGRHESSEISLSILGNPSGMPVPIRHRSFHLLCRGRATFLSPVAIFPFIRLLGGSCLRLPARLSIFSLLAADWGRFPRLLFLMYFSSCSAGALRRVFPLAFSFGVQPVLRLFGPADQIIRIFCPRIFRTFRPTCRTASSDRPAVPIQRERRPPREVFHMFERFLPVAPLRTVPSCHILIP